MKQYCIHMIKHDLDTYMNVSLDEQSVFESVDCYCTEYNVEFVSATAFFDTELDAIAFMKALQPSSVWIGDKSAARGTIRVIGFELCELEVNDNDEVEDVDVIDMKFEAFAGKYKTLREYWDDGNM